ncbi:MAG: purine-nucleoside phosphorylase, partial [Nocardioides sp.]
MATPDGYDDAHAAAERLAELTGADRHDALVVLGSGWGPAADAFGEPTASFPMTRLPGFRAPVAEGHRGEVRSVVSNGQR